MDPSQRRYAAVVPIYRGALDQHIFVHRDPLLTPGFGMDGASFRMRHQLARNEIWYRTCCKKVIRREMVLSLLCTHLDAKTDVGA